MIVFPFADDYTFGILQSVVHWVWFTSKGSTHTERPRYTSDSVFDTFPWPQTPTLTQATKVAEAAVSFRQLRRKILAESDLNLRELYRTLELPGQHPLRTAQDKLDTAVRAAYGMKPKDDILAFLLALNAELADHEATMKPVVGPGLPPVVKDRSAFVTADRVGTGMVGG